MGTGKSVVARRLAERLDYTVVDLDAQIVVVAGKSIPEIFRDEGEAGFRHRETEAVRSLGHSTETIIATGGGVMGTDENVRLLGRLGTLVCLTARPEVILERTRPWAGRPLLAGSADPLERISFLMAARADRYALADVTIDTSSLEVDGVVDEICRALK